MRTWWPLHVLYHCSYNQRRTDENGLARISDFAEWHALWRHATGVSVIETPLAVALVVLAELISMAQMVPVPLLYCPVIAVAGVLVATCRSFISKADRRVSVRHDVVQVPFERGAAAVL